MQEERRVTHNEWKDHLKEDEEFQRKTLDFENKIVHVLFGDEKSEEVGMKAKVDEIHALLTQAKAVGGFFGGIKSIAGWLLVIGALIALLKGWLGALVAWVIIK